jgi:hypothetical protein
MNEFKHKLDSGQIFLGNGEYSMAEAYQLHRKLERALNVLGGLQQCAFEKHDEFVIEDWANVEQLAKEIYESLTGNELVEASDA